MDLVQFSVDFNTPPEWCFENKVKMVWPSDYLPTFTCFFCGADTMHIPCKAGTRRHLHLVTPPWQCCLQWHHARRDAHSLPMAAAGIASFSSRRRPGSSCGSAGMSQLLNLLCLFGFTRYLQARGRNLLLYLVYHDGTLLSSLKAVHLGSPKITPQDCMVLCQKHAMQNAI